MSNSNIGCPIHKLCANSDSYNEILDRIDCLQRNVAGLHQSQTNSMETIRLMILEAINEIIKEFRFPVETGYKTRYP
jgi:hypothetical protein